MELRAIRREIKVSEKTKEEYIEWAKSEPPTTDQETGASEQASEDEKPAGFAAFVKKWWWWLLGILMTFVLCGTTMALITRNQINFEISDQPTKKTYTLSTGEEEEEIIFGQITVLNYTMLDVIDIPMRHDFFPSAEEYAALPMEDYRLKEIRYKHQDNGGALSGI